MEYQINDDETVASAILQAVSAFEDCAILSLPPLHETVRPEAVNRLFQEQFESSPVLSFKYSNSHITIDGDNIEVSSEPPEKRG